MQPRHTANYPRNQARWNSGDSPPRRIWVHWDQLPTCRASCCRTCPWAARPWPRRPRLRRQRRRRRRGAATGGARRPRRRPRPRCPRGCPATGGRGCPSQPTSPTGSATWSGSGTATGSRTGTGCGTGGRGCPGPWRPPPWGTGLMQTPLGRPHSALETEKQVCDCKRKSGFWSKIRLYYVRSAVRRQMFPWDSSTLWGDLSVRVLCVAYRIDSWEEGNFEECGLRMLPADRKRAQRAERAGRARVENRQQSRTQTKEQLRAPSRARCDAAARKKGTNAPLRRKEEY